MVYLDYAATAPLRPEALSAFERALRELIGNPSSVHRLGLKAEGAVRHARQQVADALGCQPQEIVFTSGGTESNNLAIKGFARDRRERGRHLVTSLGEHSSVLESFRALERDGFQVTYLPLGADGVVSAEAVREAVREDTILVSLQVVNNETGALQPVEETGRWLKTLPRPPRFHVDAVQGLGRVPLPLADWGVDAASFSIHKLGGPKGVGVLYVRRGAGIEPILHGGGQEGGLRSGTENVPGIVAAGVAVELAVRELPRVSSHMAELRRALLDEVRNKIRDVVVIGPEEEDRRAPHIVAVSVPGLRGEVVLHALEERNVYVSTGSACSSRKGKGSHVLGEMGLDPAVREGMVRLSFGPDHTRDDVEKAARAFVDAVGELRAFFSRRGQ